MAAKLSFNECVLRVKTINDSLRKDGYTCDEIDKFWKDVFTICDGLKMKKMESVEVYKIEENGN